nr:retrovirus-related Pol polyprotein from transposon TNT 1-94 [Tanacetum cinerariifolium]
DFRSTNTQYLYQSGQIRFRDTYGLEKGQSIASWMSKKHDCTAMSSAEAEYVALSASCAQVMWMSLIQTESDSLPHAHDQTTNTYYKHQDSRIKKAQVLKTKTSTKSDIKDNSSKTKLQGRLLESFQEDAKYEHVGQDTRSQGGKDDQDKQGKYLEISKQKTKSKDNDKAQDKRSHNMKEQAYNIIKTKDSRNQ